MVVCTCSNTNSFVPLQDRTEDPILINGSVGLVMIIHQNVLDAHSFYLCPL